MVQVIPVILTFHTYGTGISAGIISDLYRDHICSVQVYESSVCYVLCLPFCAEVFVKREITEARV